MSMYCTPNRCCACRDLAGVEQKLRGLGFEIPREIRRRATAADAAAPTHTEAPHACHCQTHRREGASVLLQNLDDFLPGMSSAPDLIAA